MEIARSIYAGWEQGNFSEGPNLFDPEILFESVMPDSSERIVAHRPEGIEEFMREFLTQWRDYRMIGDDFRQLDADTVLVDGRQAGIGRRSGVSVEIPIYSVWTLQDGKVIRLIVEFDRQKALEAAGLRE